MTTLSNRQALRSGVHAPTACLPGGRADRLPHRLAGRLAAPSFVLPGTVAENVRFLAGKVDEIALCFFETRACLDYGPADLPPDLLHSLPQMPLQDPADGGLRFHLHLPGDLPWPAGQGVSGAAIDAARAAHAALSVSAKAAFLMPTAAVLHPPHGSPARKRRLLKDFAQRWQAASAVPLLLENIDCCDLAELGRGFTRDTGLGICLDVGHLLGYAQHALAASDLPEQAALIHWSAPGRRDEHLPLTALTPAQRATATELMPRLPDAAVHLAEVFHWAGAAATLAALGELAESAAAPAAVQTGEQA